GCDNQCHGLPLVHTTVIVKIRNGARVTPSILTVTFCPSVGRVVRALFLNRAEIAFLYPVAVIGVNKLQKAEILHALKRRSRFLEDLPIDEVEVVRCAGGKRAAQSLSTLSC